MTTLNIHEAKTHLSRLLDDVEKGAEVTIARAGKPIAKLVALTSGAPVRKPGFLKGRIRIARDFDAPLPEEVIALFEGRR